ncbi:MAG: ATP-binding protein [Frankiaceae bacterium]
MAEAVAAAGTSTVGLDDPRAALWQALDRIDALLATAADTAAPGADPDSSPEAVPLPGAGESLGGQYDDAGDGAGLLGPLVDAEPWRLLARTFGLAEFDLDVLALALAPHIDMRYADVYRLLRGGPMHVQHVQHVQGPALDMQLALRLLCRTRTERLYRLYHALPDSPLVSSGAVSLTGEPSSPTLAMGIVVDPQVVRAALGLGGLDPRLAGWCSVTSPHPGDVPAPPLDRPLLTRLFAFVDRAVSADTPCRVHLHGPVGVGKRTTALALAARAGIPLLRADLSLLARDLTSVGAALPLMLREAWLFGYGVLIEAADNVLQDEFGWARLCEAIRLQPGLVMLTSTGAAPPGQGIGARMLSVELAVPPAAVRRQLWLADLAEAARGVDDVDAEALASRFRLTPAQISDAVEAAVLEERCLPTGARVDAGMLFAAARRQSRTDLAQLAGRVEPAHEWGDLVLPDDSVEQLREICARVSRRDLVVRGWGFGRGTSRGNGTAVLFAGPSGTGKTMAAEVVAREVGLDLYKIDLSGVVSKYIGETERNLTRIFGAAENANAILFFDEADALFGKRSSARDAHDRYANVEVSFLLQRLEEYDGVALLASNLPHNIDEGFARRLTATVHFPFPDEQARRRIWSLVWPPQAPLAGDVDLDRLATEHKLSGGGIRAAALRAAFRAAGRASTAGAPAGSADLITMDDVLHAVRREFKKLGKALPRSDP